MKHSVNINDVVTVYLTEYGKEVVERNFTMLNYNKDSHRLTCELWLLMKIFGNSIYMGGDIPFKNNEIIFS